MCGGVVGIIWTSFELFGVKFDHLVCICGVLYHLLRSKILFIYNLKIALLDFFFKINR